MEFRGRSTGQEPTCLCKADDVILLAPVGFRKRPLRGPVEALQGSPQGSRRQRPARGGAPAEAQLVQDAALGQAKQQVPVALHVQGRLPAGCTLSASSGSGPQGCGQDQDGREQGADHRQGACLSSAPETEPPPRDSGSPAVGPAPSLPAAGGPGGSVSSWHGPWLQWVAQSKLQPREMKSVTGRTWQEPHRQRKRSVGGVRRGWFGCPSANFGREWVTRVGRRAWGQRLEMKFLFGLIALLGSLAVGGGSGVWRSEV